MGWLLNKFGKYRPKVSYKGTETILQITVLSLLLFHHTFDGFILTEITNMAKFAFHDLFKTVIVYELPLNLPLLIFCSSLAALQTAFLFRDIFLQNLSHYELLSLQ